MEYKLNEALEILKRTPSVVATMTKGLEDHWIYSNEGEDSWSSFDIVGHLIHGEKTDWITRVKVILFEKDKTFTPFDRFAQFEDSKGKSLSELLMTFSQLREQNIERLKSLNISEEQYSLEGIHPALGKASLKQLLATWVVHDLGHVAQIARVMAKQYKTEVGPWEAYLPILNK